MTGLVLLIAMLGPVAAPNKDIDYETARLERRIKAVKISEKITIDGRLNEGAWSDAPLAKDFIQAEPREGEPSVEQTEVRVLYDQQNIYFGVHAHDSGVKHVVIADLKKDFPLTDSDSIEIVLDTFHDGRNGYIFSTNAAGAKGDAQIVNEGRDVNQNWDGVWYVETSIADDGWIAEIAIPFRTFKFRETDVQTWGINFHRNLRSNIRNETSYWSPLQRIYNIQRVSQAGTLEGLEGIKPGSNIRFKPYSTWNFKENGLTGKRNSIGAFGFDAKYGLTTGLTWDFTYNTDFSQVEADEQQINLTRFSLFFPEKREFFLENSGIFKFGGGDFGGLSGALSGRTNGVPSDVLFFSRSIGISPDGQPVPIVGGTRLTGREGPYEIGFINMQQRRYNTVNATNFTVGRLKRNILKNSDIGFIVMNKETRDSALFNRVMGGDANIRFGQYTSFNTFIAKSSSPGVSSMNLYWRAALRYTDRVWDVQSAFNSIQDNFINDMGYVPRRGIERSYLAVRKSFRPQIEAIRLIQPHVVIDYFADQNNHIDSKYVDYHFPINFQNGSQTEMGRNATIEVLQKPFVLNNGKAVVPAGVYNYYDWFIFYRPDTSRRFQPQARVGTGPFYTGYKQSYTISETLRINGKFNTSLTYTLNNIKLANARFKTNLLSTRINYSFSTTVFLNALVQYNSDTRQWSSNVRFNIIHRPLSDFFLVYNERRNTFNGDLLDRALIAKLTYMISR